MIINKSVGAAYLDKEYVTEPPDDFVSESKKNTPSYIKWVLDYYTNKGYIQYYHNRKKFSRNYDLLKGIIDARHFYEEDANLQDFIGDVMVEDTLPQYVKNYPMMISPINQMVGELINRSDNSKVRAFDSFSQNEEFDFKSSLLENYLYEQAYARIVRKLQMRGEDIGDIDPQQLQQSTWESIKDQITDYTSEGEIWGNATLQALKAELNSKEKKEEALRDMLLTNELSFHIFEDNSPNKLNYEVANPIEVFSIGNRNEKRIHKKDAAGIIRSMSLTEIINRFSDLTKEEIDHLRKCSKLNGDLALKPSNLFSSVTGPASMQYDTYDYLAEMEREIAAFSLDEELGPRNFLSENNSKLYAYKYTVVEVYYWGKKKIGKLTYLDEDGFPQEVLVDENYKAGSPNEIEIEWGWTNQLMYGRKIGNDVYTLKPYTLIDSIPIIGIKHEIKNTSSVSMAELMKPFQVLYDVCWNQIYEIAKKEKGKQLVFSTRYIPGVKDGDAQDAIDLFQMEMDRAGIIYTDDSPENLKGAASQQPFAMFDLNRAQEIQSRLTLAIQLKSECMSLLGFTPQRFGSVSASETAEGTRAALTQSYAQTEPYFQTLEYVSNDLYQALLDAAKNIESRKEITTLSYINDMGMNSFVRLTGSQLSLLALHLVPVSRNEDNALFQELRSLAQPMLQNGASINEISLLFSSNSIRQWQKATKIIDDRRKEFEQKQQEMQQQQLQQEQQIAQAKMQADAQQNMLKMQNDNDQKERDRQAKIEVALITAASFNNGPQSDTDSDGVPDVLEQATYNQRVIDSQTNANLKQQELTLKQQEILSKHELGLKKLEIEKANQANDLEISKLNLQNAKTRKNK